MKRIVLIMTVVVFGISNSMIRSEDNDSEQNHVEKPVLPQQEAPSNNILTNNNPVIVESKKTNIPKQKPILEMAGKEGKNSLNKAFDLLSEIPVITNDFISDYPLETLGTAAVFGCLMPRLTVIIIGTGLLLKYKNTPVGDKINAKVNKAVEFLRAEWKDISDNYKSKD